MAKTKTKKTNTCPCLEIQVGKRKRLVAGVSNGAMAVSLSWGDAPDGKRLKRPTGRLIVVGVSLDDRDREFARWADVKLKPGDQVILRCVEGDSPDPPISEHRFNAKAGKLVKIRRTARE